MDVKITDIMTHSFCCFSSSLLGHSPESVLFSQFEISDSLPCHRMGELFSES